MYSLNTKIERLPGIGPSLKKTLNNLGLFYIEDLFYHIPFRYIDFSQKIAIGKAEPGQMVTLEGKITSINARRSFRSRLQFTEAILEDNTGEVHLMWFNQPYLAKQFSEGDLIVIAGKIEWRLGKKQITNPYFEKVTSDELLEPKTAGKILPIYHLTKGITNLRLLKLVKISWENCKKDFAELLNQQSLKTYNLPSIAKSLQDLHFPTDQSQINASRYRIAIDDCLPQQVASSIRQKILIESSAPKLTNNVEVIKNVVSKLPFTLTDGQKRATWDILQDMATGHPMNRLLEGDVGSGKTVVAWLAAYMAALDGYQTIILAPTEILASQHYETFLNLTSDQESQKTGGQTGEQTTGQIKSQIALLTRNFVKVGTNESIDKEKLTEQLSSGNIKIIIGTHALLNDNLHFSKLGLVIIDEQHRFGVSQRAFLQKTHKSDLIPHLLSMTATPIPRTLALSLFGNLEISQLTQLPAKRQKITTKLLSEADRNIAYDKISTEILAGRQSFIITPKVEESETEVKSVKAEYERLQKLFPKFKLGLVYGGLRGEEKDNTMNLFKAGKIDILVATTVIEIGIDIPNASVILIEGAENFGLAQLHQLRGRVGRGPFPSFCYLFTTTEEQMETNRLKIFEQVSDGFALAEHDLQERGFGDLFGEQQSGFAFRFPKFVTIAALKQAREIAQDILRNDPQLTNHQALKKLSDKYLEVIHTE